jgi:hypothetical protein
VQYAFEAVVVSLGAVRLIKFEAVGLYYFDDAAGEVQPPDFCIVLRDGTQLLVEVKSVPPSDKRSTVRDVDMAAAQRYADATGGRLLYAHYWTIVGQWTLVDPSAFNSSGARQRISLEDAFKSNEMSALLGDGMIATEPPITVSVIMDRDKERVVKRLDEGKDIRHFAPDRMQLLNAGKVVTDPLEQQLAWFLFWNSRWPVTEEYQFDEDGHLARVDCVCAPYLPDEEAARQIKEQGMAIVGALSEMNTRRLLQVTTTEGGDIRALRDEPEPALLAKLVPDDYWDRQDRVLSLWRLNQVPSTVATESD